jgi:5-methylcytosine-specific restriction endonuclease McrA
MALIPLLRDRGFLAETKFNYPPLATESEHRRELIRYLQEIPQDFLSIAEHPQKREMVKAHLQAFYRGTASPRDVEIVLERVTSLALVVKFGREKCQDRARQTAFKNAHWKEPGRCVICGHAFRDVGDVSLDHIIPLALGGPEKETNWQLTCRACNQQKKCAWGIADISRTQCLTVEEGFFGKSQKEILTKLKAPSSPTRYWVFERDERKCVDCSVPASAEKLYVAVLNTTWVITIDHLITNCTDCAKREGRAKID